MAQKPDDVLEVITEGLERDLDPLAPLTSVEEAALRRACRRRSARRPRLKAEEIAQVLHWARVQKTWNMFLDLVCRGHGSISEVRDSWPVIWLTQEGQRQLKQYCRDCLVEPEPE